MGRESGNHARVRQSFAPRFAESFTSRSDFLLASAESDTSSVGVSIMTISCPICCSVSLTARVSSGDDPKGAMMLSTPWRR